MTLRTLGLSLLLLALAGCAGITSVTPRTGLPGTIVEIQGRGFSPVWYENEVTIGGSRARVIEGSSTRIRVVALRDLATGKVVVQTPVRTLTSKTTFRRHGDTRSPTPERDSGPELVEGSGHPLDKRYDMAAKGTNQKILVVLAKPSDIDPETKIPNWANAEVGPFASSKEFIQQLISHPERGLNRYWKDATYGQTSGDFFVTDWMPLSQPWDFYAWGPADIASAQTAVDNAQAALDALLANPSTPQADIDAAQATLDAKKAALKLAQDSSAFLQEPDFAWAEALIGAKNALGGTFDSYGDHFLVLAGDWMRGSCCWVGTGFHAESTALNLGPFDITFPAPRGGTWMAEDGMPGRMGHELSHFFASGDLYDGNASIFDLMGSHDPLALYSAYNQHLRGDWIDQSDPGGNVVKLEWGTPADFDETFELAGHEVAQNAVGNDVKQIIRLKVTNGLYYFVEVRQNPDSSVAATDYSFDKFAPAGEPAVQAGVLITKVLESNNQSNNLEPMITLPPPQTTPSVRTMAVGDVFTDPARTIRVTVVSRTQDRPAKYRVRVEWGHLPAPDPNGQFDLRINPWQPPPYETVDIWANSPKNDTTSPAAIVYKNHEPGDESKPVGNGDPPWVANDNTLFARVQNQGMVETPEDVRVTFYVNTPPGVGDNGTWAPFDTVIIGKLAANETRVIEATRKWRPAVGEHTCVRVLLEPMTGEVSHDNNEAQENFGEFDAAGSSPYRAVEMDVVARNPYDRGIVMDLMARDVPRDWYVAIDHGAVWLEPKAEKKIHAVVWTDRIPEWEEREKNQGPRKATISIEGWVGRPIDRFFPVGGVTAHVQAVRKVAVRVSFAHSENKVGGHIGATGQVVPSVNEPIPIALHLEMPDGTRIVERTMTNGAGAFTHTFAADFKMPGTYRLQAFVLGGSAAGEAESLVVTVPVS